MSTKLLHLIDAAQAVENAAMAVAVEAPDVGTIGKAARRAAAIGMRAMWHRVATLAIEEATLALNTGTDRYWYSLRRSINTQVFMANHAGANIDLEDDLSDAYEALLAVLEYSPQSAKAIAQELAFHLCQPTIEGQS